jgi:hypothetical protein
LVNSTRGEAANLALPTWFANARWDEIDHIAWRDPKAPLRGYLILWRGDQPLGVMLRAADTVMSRRIKAMCLLCHSAQSADLVSLFTARRAGAPGRHGNTVGTYMCADLRCSDLVLGRASFQLQADPASARVERAAGLRQRVDGFISAVLGPDGA